MLSISDYSTQPKVLFQKIELESEGFTAFNQYLKQSLLLQLNHFFLEER